MCKTKIKLGNSRKHIKIGILLSITYGPMPVHPMDWVVYMYHQYLQMYIYITTFNV